MGKPREPQRATAPHDLQPMATAPRDGRRVRLWLRDGGDFVGYYTDRWWGWVDAADFHPLIRGDIRFLGWTTVDEDDALVRPAVASLGPAAAPVVQVETPVVSEARPVKITSRIVTARKPRPRR